MHIIPLTTSLQAQSIVWTQTNLSPRWRGSQKRTRTMEHSFYDYSPSWRHWNARQHRSLLALSPLDAFPRHLWPTFRTAKESSKQAAQFRLCRRCRKSLDCPTWVRRERIQLRLQPSLPRDCNAGGISPNYGEASWCFWRKIWQV